MTTTVRTFYPTDPAPPLEDGFFIFGNGKRRRARWTGDVVMIEQSTITPKDPKVAAEAERLNALHRDTIYG